MFDFVRQHNKIMQFLLVLLIFPSFVLFGIDGYNRFREKGAAVAVVDGQEISQSQWDNAQRVETQQLRQSMPNLDPKWLDSPEVKYEILERLVRDQLLTRAAEKLNLNVSDQKLASELQKNPTIASLKKPDGSLDIERYKQLLASQGMTPESFEQRMRADLAMQQVITGIARGSFVPTSLDSLANLSLNQEREIQVQIFRAEDFLQDIKPTEDELKNYYESHSSDFKSIEQADVQYLVLDLASVERGISVSEADLKTYYDQNNAKLAGQEERRASHILITVGKDATADVRSKAREHAQNLLQQLRKSPQLFAEIAKKESQDPVSASKGGDLDFFTKGAMVKPFEDAVFAMQKGQISELVESDFGYHIIKLTDIKSLHSPSFTEMRSSLEAQVRRQMAQKKFAEEAELFTNLVYEQADSLKPAADKFKLELRTANAVTPTSNSAELGPLKNPKLLSELFSEDAIQKKHNTQAIEISPNTLASARVIKYSPARVLTLEEVKDKVKNAFVKERALAIAKSTAIKNQSVWSEHSDSAHLSANTIVSRVDTHKLDPLVVEAALRAPAQKLPVWTGVDLGAQGYAVIRVNRVIPPSGTNGDGVVGSKQSVSPESERSSKAYSAAENLAYYNFLKSTYKVKINEASPSGLKMQK